MDLLITALLLCAYTVGSTIYISILPEDPGMSFFEFLMWPVKLLDITTTACTSFPGEPL